MRPHQLTPLHIQSMVARWKQEYSRTTTYQRAAALRRFFRWLRSSGGPDYVHAVPKVPAPIPRKRIASPEELSKLFTYANGLMRTVMILCLDTACRIGEALTICPEHYNGEKRILTVPQLKNHQPRQVPVSDRLRSLFEALPEAAPLTPVAEIIHGRTVSYALVEKAWLTLKQKVGCPGLRFHDLRRTTATALHEVSKDVFAVQQLLGHTSLHATAYYISNADPEKLRPLLKLLEKPHKVIQ